MKVSELTALLSRVQQFAGDVEVTLRHAESEVETVITDLGIHFDPVSGQPGGELTVTHGDAPPSAPAQPEQPESVAAPADGAATAQQ